MASRRTKAPRDTAKDIILGLAPSGAGPRQPKEGVATPKISVAHSNDTQGKEQPRPTAPVAPNVVVDRRPDNSAIHGLQSQLSQLQKENKELLQAEQETRKRLEANLTASSRSFEDVLRQVASLNNEISSLRLQLERQGQEISHLNRELQKRAVFDPSKISSSTQQLVTKIRDNSNQLSQLKQSQEMEKSQRDRDVRSLNDEISRLQDIVRQQDQARSDILSNLSRKDMDKDKITEEARRLNDRINLITGEVTRNTTEAQERMRDDFQKKYGSLEAQLNQNLQNIAELDRKLRSEGEQQNVSKQLQEEKNKNKGNFKKVNEALASLEKHLEKGNRKMESLLAAEVNSRHIHEKGLLFKIQEVEEHLIGHLASLNKSVEDVKAGKNSRVPSLDIDALRREMEAIAADKNKLTMEGLLKLEEKITTVQSDFTNQRQNLQQKVSNLDDNEASRRLKGQMGKLDSVQEDMDKVQARIKDKVENQIPKDLNELSAKQENMRHKLNTRIGQEEEERYLAVKELQDAFQRLQEMNSGVVEQGGASLKKDVDEVKTAIKKLAESVTTVKNVLDKKITDEAKTRERDMKKLQGSGTH